MNKYNGASNFIQVYGFVEKLVIIDSELYKSQNGNFAPKNTAKNIKIKNSKYS